MNKLATWAGVGTMVALALSGCMGQKENRPATPAPTPASSATPLDLGQFTPAPNGAVDEDTGETIEPQPAGSWDAPSRTAALEAAQTAMAAFARPALGYDTWWAELSPLLTQQAQQDYAYVDPANIPVAAVTAAATLTDETSTYVAAVEVPTDAGTYTLILTRADGQAPWLTSRFTPPEGIN